MQAGEDADGDKRGKQSIALRIQGPESFRRLDMRVDDHRDPLTELRRLYEVAKSQFIPVSPAFLSTHFETVFLRPAFLEGNRKVGR